MNHSPLKTLFGVVLVAYLFACLVFVFIASHIGYQPLLGKPSISPIVHLPDFSTYANVKEKKAAFFAYLRPLIEAENAQIVVERDQLTQIKESWEQTNNLTSKQQAALDDLLSKYDVDPEFEPAKQFDRLMLKVNIIPPSLVLAQAANESAWGTSRFAREGNNLFGQWCFTKGCGIVPKLRDEEAFHEVRRFNSPAESIASYCRNINTHNAYKGLRKIRAELSQNGQTISGYKLAAGLNSYSERGETYIEELRDMMRTNRLEPGIPKRVKPAPKQDGEQNPTPVEVKPD
ncbi:glucosaminidase domain-containing protein [Teredinibacter sp. KSP-S5-2]|uniref:glucosaminidase domain-containing protein n=1 Tax=Teredinibacter sp. KSP-S5-2 TaxID=3034506 RepID=UPI002934A66C|nr:glucosaminidase domain-containing protein [Teredinibacter sp. KSP-S5-2]WNO09435.1 glucosaminidase domain-containing protein [Teredinibacter sp. KSP-S5-2]